MSEAHGAGGPPIRGWRARVAWLALIGAAWIVIPAQFARWSFLGQLMVHWTVHAAFCLLVALVIWRRQRHFCLIVLALMLLALWPWLLAAWSPRSAPIAAGEADLRVASLNLQIDNPRPAAELPAVRESQADLLALIEVDAADEASLRGDPRWPHQYWLPRSPAHQLGLALLSRRPVDSFIVHDILGFPAIEARLLCDGRALHALAVHPLAPVGDDAWRQRDAQLERLARIIADMNGPVLALGDWNLTIADPAWRRFLAASGLQRAPGRAPATWPSLFGPVGIGIDHVLAGHGARVDGLHAIRIAGSDHRGIGAVIAVP